MQRCEFAQLLTQLSSVTGAKHWDALIRNS